MKTLHPKLRGTFQEQHSLADYTYWQIGGPAQYFYQPADLDDLALFLQHWDEEPITILGAGSNVLIRDTGISGVTIRLREALNQFEELAENTLRVEAGVELMRFVKKCMGKGYSEAAFLAGIPASVGGALTMNTGAYGKSFWDYVIAFETIDRKGINRFRKPSELEIGYRQVKGLKKDEWFVAAYCQFPQKITEKEAVAKMVEVLAKRRAAQPINELSCGSVFKNPENDHAARLIQTCDIKGHQIGKAQISKKHANFIINKGGATATDVEQLMQFIQEQVLEKHGVKLEPEVRVLGDE